MKDGKAETSVSVGKKDVVSKRGRERCEKRRRKEESVQMKDGR